MEEEKITNVNTGEIVSLASWRNLQDRDNINNSIENNNNENNNNNNENSNNFEVENI